ncbi:MAG: hypothetical protein PHS02_02460 [Candidatus ainarchaeum sp.]|nr:hypothetical protein [Candidatus ainarchaeum sp.]
MINGIRLITRDKTAFSEKEGIRRRLGRPMDLLSSIPKNVKLLHIVDLNAKNGNATNFDLYDHMMYKFNVEVETAPEPAILKKLFAFGARAVVELPLGKDLKAFEGSRLLVGKTDGKEIDGFVHDYYVEAENLEIIASLAKKGKRVFVHSEKLSDSELEKAGAFAVIRNFQFRV